MRTSKRINPQAIKFLITFMPFLTISSYLMSDSMNLFIKYFRLIIAVYAAVFYFKRELCTKADLFFFSAHLIVLTSTLINHGTFINQVYRTYSVIGFMMMFKVHLNENPKLFLKVVYVYGCILSIFTALSMFVYYKPGEFEGGMRTAGVKTESGRIISGNWYLLGLDNSSFFYIFTIMIILAFYQIKYKKKISKSYFILYTFITIAFFYVESATSMICFVIGGIVIFLVNSRNIDVCHLKIFNYNQTLLVVFAFALLIVVLRLQNVFESFIVDTLHKTTTLTRRTEIWDVAFVQIKNRPILGVGAQSDIYNYMLFKVSHVHNVVVEWLYEGGIIALGCFVYGVYLYGKKTIQCHNQRLVKLISGGIIVFFFNTCFDYYTYVFLPYSLLILAEYVKLNDNCIID